jgi:hypothetical protein
VKLERSARELRLDVRRCDWWRDVRHAMPL